MRSYSSAGSRAAQAFNVDSPAVRLGIVSRPQLSRLTLVLQAPWIAALLLSSFAASALGQALPVDNRVLVRVNDRIITKYEYERQVAGAMAALAQSDITPDQLQQRRQELPQQVLRTMWDDLLVLSRGDQLGISISDFEVDETILEQMKQFGMENKEQLERALGQSGLSFEQYRKNIRGQMLQQRVLGSELFPRIQLEEDELRRVYRERQNDYKVAETRAFQELVVLESRAGSELDVMAVRVASAWSSGEDPQAITEREGDAVRFIDLGTVGQEDLAPALAEIAFAMREGQVSEPVVARGGLHILKATEVVPERVQTFEEVRGLVEQEERGRRLETEREKYLKELEESSYYETNLPVELADFKTTTGFNPGAGGLSDVSTSPLGIGIELDAVLDEPAAEDSSQEGLR